MSPSLFLRIAIEPALSLLPPQMDTSASKAMLLAICLQESGLKHRAQVGGPARGYPQFEAAGIQGVLDHHATRDWAKSVLIMLDYPPDYGASEILSAVQHNDILACSFARLLLWTVPEALPGRYDADSGWRQYAFDSWRPGKPRRDTWNVFWEHAWDVVAT